MAHESQLTFAELLTLLHGDTGLTEDECLEFAGFRKRKTVVAERVTPSQRTPSRRTEEADSPTLDPGLTSAMASPPVFCIVEHVESLGTTAAQVDLVEPPALAPSSGDSDAVPEVSNFDPELTALKPPQLITAAETIALTTASVAERQVSQWLHSLSRAEIPRRSSPIEAAVESGDVLLIEEYSHSTMPWWSDIRAASAVLKRHFGSSRLRSHRLLQMDKRTLWGGERWPQPSAGSWVLVLGALGSKGACDGLWSHSFRAWREQGVRIALWSPCEVLSDLSQDHLSVCLPWESIARRGPNARHEMLACLSSVQWCSPELLRFWRRYFKGAPEDEAAVWHHVDVWQEPSACGLAQRRDTYRPALRALGRDVLLELRAAARVLRPGLTTSTCLEEDAWARALGLEIDDAAFDHLLQAEVAQGTENSEQQAWVDSWLRRLAFRQAGDEVFWRRNEALRARCEEALRRGARGGRVELPDGFVTRAAPRRVDGAVSVLFSGDQLTLVSGESTTALGLPLWRFDGADEVRCAQGSQQAVLKPPAEQALAVGSERFYLAGGAQAIHCRRLPKPSWATRIEQTADGVIATLDDDRQVQWCAAGGPHEVFLKGNPGAWIDRDQLHPTFPAPTQGRAPYPTLTEGGGPPDSIMEVEVAGGVPPIRLRWIPPGEFQMGSPRSELGRWDREQQHHVTLTRGFWMMETACSQSLWRAVTHQTPSSFPGEEQPIDRVSWVDIHELFLPTINASSQGLEFRLPTEAQWEYACRAGTASAFPWGDRISFDDARFLGHENITYWIKKNRVPARMAERFGEHVTDSDWADWLHVPVEAIEAARWGDKAYFRQRHGTLPVYSFRPNGWGLYQMCGNVYEWCADALEDLTPYGLDARVDPCPNRAGDRRIIRGGSWNELGWDLRAAYRDRIPVDSRFNNVGFRLVATVPNDGAWSKGDAATVGRGLMSPARQR